MCSGKNAEVGELAEKLGARKVRLLDEKTHQDSETMGREEEWRD